MPAPSVQDIKAVLDVTGLTSLNASQIFNTTDTSAVGDDRGMTVETTDSATDTPVVPDAVTTTKWKRFIWKRRSFGDATKAKLYYWDDFSPSVATYLRWIEVTSEVSDALTLAQDAKDTADIAKDQSDEALSNATTAQLIAQDALTRVAALEAVVTDLASIVDNLQARCLTGLFVTGDLRHTTAATVYSKTANEGWLECDGSEVSKALFPALYAQLTTLFGTPTDTNLFALPDFRGRTLIGTNDGVDNTTGVSTVRTVGQQEIGEENHALTSAESGMPGHNTDLGQIQNSNATGLAPAGAALTSFGSGVGAGDVQLISTGADAENPHNTMQPSAVSRILIKT